MELEGSQTPNPKAGEVGVLPVDAVVERLVTAMDNICIHMHVYIYMYMNICIYI